MAPARFENGAGIPPSGVLASPSAQQEGAAARQASTLTALARARNTSTHCRARMCRIAACVRRMIARCSVRNETFRTI